MKQLITTTNAVRLSFLCALLRDGGIDFSVYDTQISALESDGKAEVVWRAASLFSEAVCVIASLSFILCNFQFSKFNTQGGRSPT